jgi:hypothetical protein
LAYNLRHVENQKRKNPFPLKWELDMAVNDLAKKIFGSDWETAVRRQKGYMRKHLAMGNSNPEEFGDRLIKLNRYLRYFPKKIDSNSKMLIEWPILPEDELVDILDSAKKPEWHLTMLSQGRRPETFESVAEAIMYYKQLLRYLLKKDVLKRLMRSR